jgi:hypothetical protein
LRLPNLELSDWTETQRAVLTVDDLDEYLKERNRLRKEQCNENQDEFVGWALGRIAERILRWTPTVGIKFGRCLDGATG